MASSPKEDGFIRLGEFVVSFELDDLTEEYRELAARELRETPEIREQALRKLKELIKAEDGLFYPDDRVDLQLIFLRATCFYPDQAMKLLRNFLAFRANNPRLSTDLLPSENPNPFLQGLVSGVPRRDQHGRRVLIINGGGQWDPNTCNVYELIRGVILIAAVASMEPKTQVAGGAVIIDLEGMGLTHVLQFSPRLASSILTLVQECMPIHLHAVHILNEPYIFDMAYSIFKPFMGHKLRNMFRFHGKRRDELIEDIGAKHLPLKYGGELEMPEIPASDIHELLWFYENELKDIFRYGYKKKPSKRHEESFQTID